MTLLAITQREFEREWVIKATKSSGAGGQHVNKVSTRIELRFSIPDSALLTHREKQMLLSRLKTRLTTDGVLIITAQEERSQKRNKEAAISRFYQLISWGLKPVKRRVPTKPSRAARQRRLEEKRKHSEKKQRRRE